MYKLIRLSSFLVLGLILLGCSNGNGESPNIIEVSNNTGSGVTDSADINSDSANTETDIDTTITSTADAQTSVGGTSANATNDSGASMGSTVGATTTGVDNSDSITDSGDTSGAISDDGSNAADTITDTGEDTSGTGETTTDSGDTADASADTTDTTGTTADDGTSDGGSITSGMSDYPAGSLAATLANRIDVMRAFSEVKAAGLDEELNNPDNTWTLFLPTNEAFAADTNFDIEKHLHKGTSLGWFALSWFVGRPLSMSDGRELSVDGGVSTPLTIADATVLETDIYGDISSHVTVHVIDSIIGEYTGAPYPGYPEGSLADVVFQSEGRSALHTLRREGFDLTLNDPNLNWTIFLPTRAAFADAATADEYQFIAHIYPEAVLSITDLNGLSGTAITMNNGVENVIGGGGNEPLTINGIPIIELGLRSDTDDGPIVYVIDGMLDTP